MASASQTEDICAVCLDSLKNPRVLDCNHAFCLECLEELENNKTITCPVCRGNTKIQRGLEVRHLLKKNIRTMTAKLRARPITVVNTWAIDSCPCDIVVDDDTGMIFVSTDDNKKPIHLYRLNGKYHGHFRAESLEGCYLTIDSKRELLVAAVGNSITTFDMDGRHTGRFECTDITRIGGVAYHKNEDVYIVVDTTKKTINFIDAADHTVTKTINITPIPDPISENIRIACDTFGSLTSFVTCNELADNIRLYNADCDDIKDWISTGAGYGQFDKPSGVCISSNGHMLVSDLVNFRIISVDVQEAEKGRDSWQVVAANLRGLGLLGVRDMDITRDGLVVANTYDNPDDGPYEIAVLKGLVDC